MFHNPRERCPHNPCLLGHDEAREAFRASKAFARCDRLAKWQQENTLLESAKKQKEEAGVPPIEEAQSALQKVQEASQKPNPPPQTTEQSGKTGKENAAVDFETLVKENVQACQ